MIVTISLAHVRLTTSQQQQPIYCLYNTHTVPPYLCLGLVQITIKLTQF